MKCNILQGRGSSTAQMFGKAGIFVIFLTKTFIYQHLGLIQCVPSSAQVTCWVKCFIPALSQQGESWEGVPALVYPERCVGQPQGSEGLTQQAGKLVTVTQNQDMQCFSVTVTPDQLKRILKVR